MDLFSPAPLVVDRPAPGVLPAYPLPGRVREGRPLFVMQRTVYLHTIHGWVRVERGYVTDFGSIPAVATALTMTDLQPIGSHAWAAIAHDKQYTIAEPGRRLVADQIFRERMRTDGVIPLRREVMYRAVRAFGQGGYDQAVDWWETENFADPGTGEPMPPPYAREEAFAGQRWGLRDRPDWQEVN